MLSRSSSSYQPLEQQAASSSSSSSGRRGPPQQHSPPSSSSAHEMTSITVISNPCSNLPAAASLPAHPAYSSNQPAAVSDGLVHTSTCNVLDFSLCARSAEKTQWTNFHFIMCTGIVGFLVFWIVLLCRMYLPLEYRFWT